MKKAKRSRPLQSKGTFTRAVQALKARNPMKTGNHGSGMLLDDLPVRDSKSPLILEVTPEDVENSSRRQPGSCAAAKAVMRQEHTTKAYIYRSKAYILRTNGNKEYYERYEVPNSLRIELGAFDKEGEFEPQEFKLSKPYPSQTTAAKKKYHMLRPATKSSALPRSSNHKKYGDYKATGKRTRRYTAIKVRPRPQFSFSK